MNKNDKTLQEVLEELKVLKKKAKEEKVCEPEKNDTPSEKECHVPDLAKHLADLDKLSGKLEYLQNRIKEIREIDATASKVTKEAKETKEAECSKEFNEKEEHIAIMQKRTLALEREIRDMKEYSDRLYDKIQDLRTALLKKQHVIDNVEELVKPLLDADSGADRHDVAEHILSVIKGSGEYAL